ncbi:hypothetical protein GCM10010106_22880 [Thermopolyspora flexuosa]|nr:hypothetical protein GCM10010106_22880 [Thermopolyspora flexuosa]
MGLSGSRAAWVGWGSCRGTATARMNALTADNACDCTCLRQILGAIRVPGQVPDGCGAP